MKVFIQERRKVWELTRCEVEVPDGTPHDEVVRLATAEWDSGRGSWDTPVIEGTVDDIGIDFRLWWEGKPK